MVNIMKGMGDILGKTTQNVNINNIQNVVEDFNYKMEEQQGINELLEDAMDADEDTIEDADVDKYIDTIEDGLGGKGGGGQKQKVEQQEDNFGDLIQDLKK